MTETDNLVDIISDQQIYGSKWRPHQWISDLQKLENGSYRETDVAERNLFGEATLVTMADGRAKMMSNIKAGDKIMSLYGESLKVKHVIEAVEEMYEIKPTRGSSNFVNGDYMLLLKATNYEMIFWDETRNRYRVRWLQNYAIKEKAFPMSLYGRGTSINNFAAYQKRSGSKRSTISKGGGPNSLQERKRNVYQHCKQYLRDMRRQPGYIGYGDIVQIRAKDYAKMTPRLRNAFKAFSIGVDLETKNKIKKQQKKVVKDDTVRAVKVMPVGKRKCCGLILDRNEKFLLADFTIGQNCY